MSRAPLLVGTQEYTNPYYKIKQRKYWLKLPYNWVALSKEVQAIPQTWLVNPKRCPTLGWKKPMRRLPNLVKRGPKDTPPPKWVKIIPKLWTLKFVKGA